MAEGPEVDTRKESDLENSWESIGAISSPSEVPLAAIAAWKTLPESIKTDPCLSTFRRGYERHLGSVSERSRQDTVDTDNEITIQVPPRGRSRRRRHSSLLSRDGDSNEPLDDIKPKKVWWVQWIKISCLVLVWIAFTIVLIMKSEKVVSLYQISIPEGKVKSYWILEMPPENHITVSLTGAILPQYYKNLTSKSMSVWAQIVEYRHKERFLANMSTFTLTDVNLVKNISEEWVVPIVSQQDLIDFVPEVSVEKLLQLDDVENQLSSRSILRLQFRTNLEANVPVAIGYDLTPIDVDAGVIYAAFVLVGLYILIIFEIVHRTLAAMLASTMSVAILAYFNERPTMSELVSWINIETLLLLFSMMVLVAIFAETGVFDYLAVFAFKITGGDVWPLINTLCFFTLVLSCFLDNVTTMLLMTPISIRLCEVMTLNPVPILMSLIMYSNVGGALTPVGDPPNVIIASNSDIIKAGVDFGTFILHMGAGLIFVILVVYFVIRCMFKDKDLRFTEPKEVQELRHEISVWQRAATSLASYSKDEDMVRRSLERKVKHLNSELQSKISSENIMCQPTIENDDPANKYKNTLENLEEKFPLRDKALLIKSAFTLTLVILLFFLHSIPSLNLSLGWTALLGALLLLVLADNEDLEGVFARVEWGTLIFFAALFVLMEALSKLGLINWVGRQTEAVILSVSESARLAVATILILWVSAAMSSLVDNIPLSTMMVRVITSLARNEKLGLPLTPLVWALAFGACLGGNGTLIGSSSNVVCAGIAEQHGYRFSFMEYFKVGFPVTIVSIVVANIYLIIAHVLLEWH